MPLLPPQPLTYQLQLLLDSSPPFWLLLLLNILAACC
jgi:hypothetical protein